MMVGIRMFSFPLGLFKNNVVPTESFFSCNGWDGLNFHQFFFFVRCHFIYMLNSIIRSNLLDLFLKTFLQFIFCDLLLFSTASSIASRRMLRTLLAFHSHFLLPSLATSVKAGITKVDNR